MIEIDAPFIQNLRGDTDRVLTMREFEIVSSDDVPEQAMGARATAAQDSIGSDPSERVTVSLYFSSVQDILLDLISNDSAR